MSRRTRRIDTLASPNPIDPHTVPTRTRLAFGVGASAEAMCLYSVAVLGMLFYNQVHGLNVLMAGLVPTIAIFVDAISDPLIGSLSDRFRNRRWGRRHPFMLVAPAPIAVSFYCVFSPPANLPEWELFAWFLGWSISLRTFMTLYHVPHLALGGELSKAYTERSKIMSYNNFFGWLGGAGVFKVNTVVFFASAGLAGNGLLNGESYPAFAITIATTIVLVLFASAWFTRDRIPTLPQPPEDLPKFSFQTFISDLVGAFSNRNYLMLMIAFFLLSLMLGVRTALSNYMNIFYWELPARDIGTLIFIGSFIGYATGFLFSARLHHVFDKRATIVATAIGLSVFPALPVILRLADTFPENGSDWLLPAIVFFQIFSSGCGSILNISVMSALADIADENEMRLGHRQEGTLYAARTFFAKLDNSIGHGIASLSLWLIAFPDNARPGEVESSTIWWLGMIDSPITIIPGLIAAVFYAQYRINRKSYEETQSRLASRRAGLPGGAREH
ncbi:MAG: MFS transporter [Pseudomonadales bacterium]